VSTGNGGYDLAARRLEAQRAAGGSAR